MRVTRDDRTGRFAYFCDRDCGDGRIGIGIGRIWGPFWVVVAAAEIAQ